MLDKMFFFFFVRVCACVRACLLFAKVSLFLKYFFSLSCFVPKVKFVCFVFCRGCKDSSGLAGLCVCVCARHLIVIILVFWFCVVWWSCAA